MSTATDTAWASFANNANTFPFRGIAVGRHPAPFPAYVAFIDGNVLREKRHQNERIFKTPEDAVRAAQKARK